MVGGEPGLTLKERAKIDMAWRSPAIVAAAAVPVLVGLKLIVHFTGIEFLELNALFTSIIAGGIFLFGVILAGTMSDYKESERIPAELVSACSSIYEDGLYVAATRDGFDLEDLRATLLKVIDGFYVDAADESSRKALDALGGFQKPFIQMEELGIPPNFIVRLKSEEAAIRKGLLRMYYIQRTGFLPSAYFFVQSIVTLLLVMLVFVKITPLYSSIIVIVFLTYLFVYILGLLKTLDRPFRQGARTRDDVSLFLLHEFKAGLLEDLAAQTPTPPSSFSAADQQ
ncbi:MAG: hypothetical protein ACYC99_09540 [Candidatus Geothermincolia bacterium]